ncbi:MAG: DinB family protein [Ignavibacterium sp.]|nr:MAG: DinB family protein [Ignavibacterium sp.]
MNNELRDVTQRLLKNITEIPSKFLSFDEDELRNKPIPEKWSKKEILGHLIDSAANNHHRFVKAQIEEDPFKIISYQQNSWVAVQNYNEMDSESLIELWKSYNHHILWIISNFDEKKLNTRWIMEENEVSGETILFLIKDYIDHMDHHLKQIFN